ncbi:MAG TPA: AAA family ATPase [Streptosporangiaceae bacterium]|jgi:DNA-binding CsgD family transcriptional regulator
MDVLGRDGELSRIAGWLGADPGPAVLIIEGEPGIGKTTLWAEAIRRAGAGGWQVLSCRPAPSDAGLPHVSLADLLRPVPGADFDALPAPQRRPLAVALLREEASEGDLDPRAIGTALTALLAGLAGQAKLILAVDDAQWLDPASARAIAFALRRRDRWPVRLLLAVRVEGAGQRRPAGLTTLRAAADQQDTSTLPVGPLTVAAVHQMLRQALGVAFARPLLVRVHRAAGGNPFYALEIAREIQRLGVPQASQPLPVPDDHRHLALLRLRRLPAPTRQALAQVAVATRPRASELDAGALAPALRAGIVKLTPDGAAGPGGRVEFTHPLFGSVLYASLPDQARQAVHRELAGRAASLEERARHLALAATGPDEHTAAELDQAAQAASARGAADMAVELKELACRLTPPQDQQSVVRRQLELADRRYFAGDSDGARRELERSAQALPPGEDRAQVLLELGSVLWAQAEADRGQELMTQALAQAQTDALRARIHSRISALADDKEMSVLHAEKALALLDKRADPALYGFVLHNLALFRLYAGRGADHDAIEEGTRLCEAGAVWEMSTVPAFWARNFDDFATARQRFEDMVEVFRSRGDEASVSGVLTHLAVIEAMTGHMDRAGPLAAEALDLAEQTGQPTFVAMAQWARAHVLTRSGDLAGGRAACAEIMRQLEAYPDIALEGMCRHVLGLAALLDGDLTEADRQLSRCDEIVTALHVTEPANERFHADHAEAVIGLGDLDRAERLVARMEARAAAIPRPWLLAVSARSRGLLNAARGEFDAALADYLRAVDAHAGLDMPAEHARTLLALGRLRRRRNERQLAQDCLARAAGLAEAASAAGLAAVARDELRRAAGRRGGPGELTPTEQEVAGLAAAGLRNHEIAARMFLSAKTVEANLSRVYRKLGIRSRADLARQLAGMKSLPGRRYRAEEPP